MLTKPPVPYDICVSDPISRWGHLRDYEPSDGTFSSTSVYQCNEGAGRGRAQPSQLSQIPRPHRAQRSGTAVLGKCRSVGQWACGNTTIFSYSSRKVMTACQTLWRNVYFSFFPGSRAGGGGDDDPCVTRDIVTCVV